MRIELCLAIGTMLFFASASAKENAGKASFPENKYGTLVSELSVEIEAVLEMHFGDFKIPPLKEFAIDMLGFYYEDQPQEAHPAYCSGDLNADGFTDHAFILRDWADQAILAVVNGTETERFAVYVVQGIRGFRDDYLLYEDQGIYRGNFEKDGFRIRWSKEKSTYVGSGR